MVLWFCQDEEQAKQAERISKYFLDREIEFETGEMVLPGWAAIGNVAALYGESDDDADPFNTGQVPE